MLGSLVGLNVGKILGRLEGLHVGFVGRLDGTVVGFFVRLLGLKDGR